MINGKARSSYKLHFHRVKVLRTVMVFVAAVLLLGGPVLLTAGIKNRKNGERRELLEAWNSGNYDAAFTLSQTALTAQPVDYFLLTVHGFSAYQLGISQINSFDTLHYIDACIRALRKALLLKDSAADGRVYYVLGKAYCNKGDDYADLAVKYLERARELAYSAPDIPEYLGIAYAATGDYRGSVEAFSRALTPAGAQPSDLLLLSIARSYAALEEFESARAYLVRCLELSRDSNTTVTARLFLAEVYDKLGDGEGARQQFEFVLETSPDNAEAHYQLGELYLRQGDTTRARSEWRLALRADPSHQKARARLN